MIERDMVFVRAQVEDGWDSVDVLDLDEESWRRWILGIMIHQQQIVCMKGDNRPPTPYRAKPGIKKRR